MLTLYLGLAILVLPFLGNLLSSHVPQPVSYFLMVFPNLVIFYFGFWFYNYLTMLTIYRFNWPRLRQDYIIVLGDGWAETQSKTILQNMQFSKQLIAQGPVKNPCTIFVTNNYGRLQI